MRGVAQKHGLTYGLEPVTYRRTGVPILPIENVEEPESCVTQQFHLIIKEALPGVDLEKLNFRDDTQSSLQALLSAAQYPEFCTLSIYADDIGRGRQTHRDHFIQRHCV